MSNQNGTGAAPAGVAFLQYLLPPLRSGGYTATAVQTVKVQGQGDVFQARQRFHVAGERYALAAGDVSGAFPPEGSQGDFSATLPHVVLSSPTLPWQRSPAADGAGPDGEVPTWLAVLLFDQDDPPPAPRQVTLAELGASGGTFAPARVAEEGEQQTDPVTVIDVPVARFNALAPSLADLRWTAHVRHVDPAARSTGDAPPPVEYAVVVGNRLPAAGSTATAHLVSLEGLGPYLPGAGGTASPALPATAGTVRLVTLHHWTFSALDLRQTFAGMLSRVDLDPPVLRLPYAAAGATGNDDADAAVRDAFALGFTALDHELRDGSSTVSWYRGPLLPLASPPGAVPPWRGADPLVRYDPATGMFDESYAAAWQLGRLMALHDAAFAAALYRWKLAHTQAQAAALERRVIGAELQGAAADAMRAPAAGPTGAAAVIRNLVGPAARRLALPETRE